MTYVTAVNSVFPNTLCSFAYNQDGKLDTYRCPTCSEKLSLHAGQKKKHHFTHYPGSGCKNFTTQSESVQHKMCKDLVADWLISDFVLRIFRSCSGCKGISSEDVTRQGGEVIQEHRMSHNESDIVVDVALIYEDRVISFEILHTHKQSNRSETWYEFSTRSLLSSDHGDDVIYLRDCREDWVCTSCRYPKKTGDCLGSCFRQCGENGEDGYYRDYECGEGCQLIPCNKCGEGEPEWLVRCTINGNLCLMCDVDQYAEHGYKKYHRPTPKFDGVKYNGCCQTTAESMKFARCNHYCCLKCFSAKDVHSTCDYCMNLIY